MKSFIKDIFVVVVLMMCFVAVNLTSYADNIMLPEAISEILTGEPESETGNFNDNNANINKDSARVFNYNGEKVTLYEADIVIDLNNDEKTNIADARILLRIAAELESEEQYDLSLCDISADGAVTASDARLLLRYVIDLDIYYTDESGMHISGWATDEDSNICYFHNNGMLASGYKEIDGHYYLFAGKGNLCYGKVYSSGTVYYFNDKGIGISGFKTIDDNKYYFVNGKALTGLATIDGTVYGFSDKGVILKGLNKIDGEYYFFSDSGKAHDGWKIIDGDKYYFKAGKALPGLTTINGTVYGFSEKGEILKGLNKINDEYYFFSDSGKAQTGWKTVNNNKYYFGMDFKAVSGRQNINGNECVFSDYCTLYSGYIDLNQNTYYYDGGRPYSGWLYDGLDSYYFYSDGKMAKNTTIGNASFNSKGIASCNYLSTDTLQIYVRDILKNIGTSTRSIFNYVHGNFRYKYYAKSTPDAMVLRILQNKKGACYDYAYLTKYLLEAAGYECYIVVGDSFNYANGSEHDWVLVKVDGVWRHIDTQKGTYLKTDTQMRNLGYKWPAQGLPAAK